MRPILAAQRQALGVTPVIRRNVVVKWLDVRPTQRFVIIHD